MLTAYDALADPDENPLTEYVYTFNTCFLQIFENFDSLVENLNSLLQSHDQIPNIINVVNEIKRKSNHQLVSKFGKLLESNVTLWSMNTRVMLSSGNILGTH